MHAATEPAPSRGRGRPDDEQDAEPAVSGSGAGTQTTQPTRWPSSSAIQAASRRGSGGAREVGHDPRHQDLEPPVPAERRRNTTSPCCQHHPAQVAGLGRQADRGHPIFENIGSLTRAKRGRFQLRLRRPPVTRSGRGESFGEGLPVVLEHGLADIRCGRWRRRSAQPAGAALTCSGPRTAWSASCSPAPGRTSSQRSGHRGRPRSRDRTLWEWLAAPEHRPCWCSGSRPTHARWSIPPARGPGSPGRASRTGST